MSLPGMKSTIDFAADERPKDWREAILRLDPRNGASLYALSALLKSKNTTDPEFYWWEEETEQFNFALAASVDGAGTTETLTLVANGTRLKPGDLLMSAKTLERFLVQTIVSDTSITVLRAVGPGGTAAGTVAAITYTADAASAQLIYVGSAYREGASRTVGTSWNPTKKYNLTQIFRTPMEITRTAQQTKFRTGDPWAEDRKRALNKHSIAVERAFWFGTRYETTDSGQPLRYTGGITSYIDSGNIITVGNSGIADMDELESWFAKLFAYGSSEKLAFASLSVMTTLSRIVRKNSTYNWGPNEKEYNLDVKRFMTPSGTLVLTENPLLNTSEAFKNDIFVIDTANLVERPIQPTTFKQDIQDRGVDGKAAEFLTETGLEVHHPKSHGWVRGLLGAIKDD